MSRTAVFGSRYLLCGLKKVQCRPSLRGVAASFQQCLLTRNVYRKLRNVSKTLLQEMGRQPSAEEMAVEADLSIEEVRRVLSMGRHAVSLDRPVGESEDSSLGEFIEDGGLPRPDKAAGNDINEPLLQLTGTPHVYRNRKCQP
jgi:RNA polymerase primary sigma factor